MNLNEFIQKYCFVEPEIDGATLWSDVESLAQAWAAVSGSPVNPLRFALHLRSLLPQIRIEEIVPGSGEVLVFGLSLTKEARQLQPS